VTDVVNRGVKKKDKRGKVLIVKKKSLLSKALVKI
jgi:hypothetical protein